MGREEAESQRENSFKRKVVVQDLQTLRQAITSLEEDWETLVEKLNAETKEKAARIGDLEEEKENLRNEYQQRIQSLEEQVGEREREFGSVFTEAEELRKTIASLEVDKVALTQQMQKFAEYCLNSRDRLALLAQEVAARGSKLKEVSQTHQVLVEELNTEIQEKTDRISNLEEEIENLRGEYQQRVQTLEEQLGQRKSEVENLQTEAQQLCEALTSVEVEKVTLSHEIQKLKEELQESRDRLEALTREVTQKDNRLEEVNQTHQALLSKLKAEIQAKGMRIRDLEKEIQNLRGEYEQESETLCEIMKSMTAGGRDQVRKKLVENLTSSRRFLLKVTCPSCQGRISRIFKAELKSKEGGKSVTG